MTIWLDQDRMIPVFSMVKRSSDLEIRIAELLIESGPNLQNLHPILVQKTKQVIVAAADQGLYFGCFMGYRSYELQGALYSQGRQPLIYVNRLRVASGLKTITQVENEKVITKAKPGESWHNFGLAVDLVEDGDPKMAGIQWSWKNNVSYIRVGKIIREAGLGWGGLWKAWKDYPHAELTQGMILGEARELYGSGGLPLVWAEIGRRAAA